MRKLLAAPVVEKITALLKAGVADFFESQKRKPKLVVVLVGEDPASVIYTTKKGKAALDVGMEHETVKFPATVSSEEFFSKIDQLNLDPSVDGILIQRPVPSSLDESRVTLCLDPIKDVDGFHPLSPHASCTPAGVMEILAHEKIALEGKVACVVGRSKIVGEPLQRLLLKANATVIQCHSKTKNLAEFTRLADVLCVAAGKPKLINASHVKPGAVVIDVGVHRLGDGKLVGDVDFESVLPVASAITPVPGGVGPMTITMLLVNTLNAALMRQDT